MALVVAAGVADAATLKERARFRDGPNVGATLLGTLPAGTELQILEDQRGWKKVTAPDGTVGWIWGDHLASEDDALPAEAAPPAATERRRPRSVAEEVRELREEIAALRARPEPASAVDVERLRSEIDRLVAEHRNLARRIDDRRFPGTNGTPLTVDRPFPTAVAALVIGALGGLLVGRFARRRRDRRARSRLTF